MTGGLAYEGLNNAGHSGRDLLVILNDNEMSISPNVGAISKHLTSITSSKYYHRLKEEVRAVMRRMPMGEEAGELAKRLERSIKEVVVPGGLRITSYNVCYTKLLRTACRGLKIP